LLEAHPFVKCDVTLLTPGDKVGEVEREDHAFIFALPVILLKFCLPWDPPVAEFDRFLEGKLETSCSLENDA